MCSCFNFFDAASLKAPTKLFSARQTQTAWSCNRPTGARCHTVDGSIRNLRCVTSTSVHAQGLHGQPLCTCEVPATSMSSSSATLRTMPPSRLLLCCGRPAARSQRRTVLSADPATAKQIHEVMAFALRWQCKGRYDRLQCASHRWPKGCARARG